MNRIHSERRSDHVTRTASRIVIDSDAIETVIVLLRAITADRHLLPKSTVPASVSPNRHGRLRFDGVNARLQGCQQCPVPAVEGHVADDLPCYYVAQRRCGSGELTHVARHFHLLVNVPNFQLNVD